MKDLFENTGTKKLLFIFGGIVGLAIFIVVILLLYNSFFSRMSYSKIETTMVEAAKKYYGENGRLLPSESGESATVNVTSLVSAGYMDELNKYTSRIDKSLSCSGSVLVTNINNQYRYSPNLICGEKYATETLLKHIRDQEAIVTSGDGLYELNGGYVFRGENPNNVVKFADRTWNIIKIQDDYIYMLYADEEKYDKRVWDNRYNIDRSSAVGINDFSVSRIHDSLNNIYNSGTFFYDDEKMLVMPFDLPIGGRSVSDIANDGSMEGSRILENQYLGLLPLYDFINASTDTNCLSASSKSCANYNYLSYLDDDWWLLTPSNENTYEVYNVTNGTVSLEYASVNSIVRPYVRLVKDVLYVDGTGAPSNPYTIK